MWVLGNSGRGAPNRGPDLTVPCRVNTGRTLRKGLADMPANRFRVLPAIGLLLAGGLFLTACNEDDSAASTPDAPAAGSSGAAKGGGLVTETGALAYLAPGKLSVGGRQFLVAEDTKVWGSGGICGDGTGQAAVECTTDELEEAAKAGGVEAEVVIGEKDGIATEVRDQTPAEGSSNGGSDSSGGSGSSGGSSDGSSGGSSTGGSTGGSSTGGSSTGGGSGDDSADGTVTGVLTYLAPGKYLVGDRAFFVADDTQVWGAGGICGDGTGQVAAECTLDDLEEAAKRGDVKAEVDIEEGVGTQVREQ